MKKIMIILLIILVVLVACEPFDPSASTQKPIFKADKGFEERNKLIGEYNYHIGIIDKDTSTSSAIITRYNNANAQQRDSIAQEYFRQTELSLSHIQAFLGFIDYNEQRLKDAEVKTYTQKTVLNDKVITLKNNVEFLNKQIESNQQAKQQSMDLLKTLAMFLI